MPGTPDRFDATRAFAAMQQAGLGRLQAKNEANRVSVLMGQLDLQRQALAQKLKQSTLDQNMQSEIDKLIEKVQQSSVDSLGEETPAEEQGEFQFARTNAIQEQLSQALGALMRRGGLTTEQALTAAPGGIADTQQIARVQGGIAPTADVTATLKQAGSQFTSEQEERQAAQRVGVIRQVFQDFPGTSGADIPDLSEVKSVDDVYKFMAKAAKKAKLNSSATNDLFLRVTEQMIEINRQEISLAIAEMNSRLEQLRITAPADAQILEQKVELLKVFMESGDRKFATLVGADNIPKNLEGALTTMMLGTFQAGMNMIANPQSRGGFGLRGNAPVPVLNQGFNTPVFGSDTPRPGHIFQDSDYDTLVRNPEVLVNIVMPEFAEDPDMRVEFEAPETTNERKLSILEILFKRLVKTQGNVTQIGAPPRGAASPQAQTGAAPPLDTAGAAQLTVPPVPSGPAAPRGARDDLGQPIIGPGGQPVLLDDPSLEAGAGDPVEASSIDPLAVITDPSAPGSGFPVALNQPTAVPPVPPVGADILDRLTNQRGGGIMNVIGPAITLMGFALDRERERFGSLANAPSTPGAALGRGAGALLKGDTAKDILFGPLPAREESEFVRRSDAVGKEKDGQMQVIDEFILGTVAPALALDISAITQYRNLPSKERRLVAKGLSETYALQQMQQQMESQQRPPQAGL